VPPRPIVTSPQPVVEPLPTVEPHTSSWPPPQPHAQPEPPPITEAPVVPISAAPRKKSRAATYAVVAMAASLALAAGAVVWGIRQRAEPVAAKTPTAAEARAALLASAADVTTLAWTATDDPNGKGSSGDVVWSASAQKGYMRFVGLAPNDAKAIQYQLWIFDKERDQAFPVDGGVFDVSSTGEVIIPITAKLRVDEPVLFAVTIEKPGGVVVSKRERIVVTAAPKA
jgi:anti-sigma-K factor RskA